MSSNNAAKAEAEKAFQTAWQILESRNTRYLINPQTNHLYIYYDGMFIHLDEKDTHCQQLMGTVLDLYPTDKKDLVVIQKIKHAAYDQSIRINQQMFCAGSPNSNAILIATDPASGEVILVSSTADSLEKTTAIEHNMLLVDPQDFNRLDIHKLSTEEITCAINKIEGWLSQFKLSPEDEVKTCLSMFVLLSKTLIHRNSLLLIDSQDPAHADMLAKSLICLFYGMERSFGFYDDRTLEICMAADPLIYFSIENPHDQNKRTLKIIEYCALVTTSQRKKLYTDIDLIRLMKFASLILTNTSSYLTEANLPVLRVCAASMPYIFPADLLASTIDIRNSFFSLAATILADDILPAIANGDDKATAKQLWGKYKGVIGSEATTYYAHLSLWHAGLAKYWPKFESTTMTDWIESELQAKERYMPPLLRIIDDILSKNIPLPSSVQATWSDETFEMEFYARDMLSIIQKYKANYYGHVPDNPTELVNDFCKLKSPMAAHGWDASFGVKLLHGIQIHRLIHKSNQIE